MSRKWRRFQWSEPAVIARRWERESAAATTGVSASTCMWATRTTTTTMGRCIEVEVGRGSRGPAGLGQKLKFLGREIGQVGEGDRRLGGGEPQPSAQRRTILIDRHAGKPAPFDRYV